MNYEIKKGYIHAHVKSSLVGAIIKFPKISVGATENAILAATLSEGKTVLKNCAIEPEIKDLVNFLLKMGCKIKWTGKRSLKISGVKEIKEISYSVMFDRIEAGTYLIAAALTEGNLQIKNVIPKIAGKLCTERGKTIVDNIAEKYGAKLASIPTIKNAKPNEIRAERQR